MQTSEQVFVMVTKILQAASKKYSVQELQLLKEISSFYRTWQFTWQPTQLFSASHPFTADVLTQQLRVVCSDWHTAWQEEPTPQAPHSWGEHAKPLLHRMHTQPTFTAENQPTSAVCDRGHREVVVQVTALFD